MVVSVTEFRQHLQEFLARVQRGHRLQITSRGRIIAEVTPPAPRSDDIEGVRRRLHGSVLRYDNPTAPAFEPSEWDMNR